MSEGPEAATIRVTWRKSAIGYSVDMKATIQSLGFRKLQQTRDLPDTPAVRGMLKKVDFLVAVQGGAADPGSPGQRPQGGSPPSDQGGAADLGSPGQRPRRARYKIPRARSAKKHSRGR